MQKTILKQVLFLIFVAFILVLLMGMLIFSSAKAEEGTGFILKRTFALNPAARMIEDDEDNFDMKRKNHAEGVVRYNRVEGSYLGMSWNKDGASCIIPKNSSTHPILYGFWGYAFESKDFQYQIGLEKGFFDSNRLAFGGEYHRNTDTPDRWVISDHENSIAAFLLKEDFQDYYFTDGASGYITQNFSEALKLCIGYQQDDWTALKKNTNWSLFGGHKRFRPNPSMDEGDVRSLTGKVVLDTRNNPKKYTRGLYIQIEGEYAGKGLNGDFDFNRFLADARWFWTLDSWEGLDIRLRAGALHGDLPWQKSFYLGGISTLRGFGYKSFPFGPMQLGGNRMALVQAEYRLGNEEFPFGLDLGFFNQFNPILFSDLGWVGQVDSNLDMWEGYDSISFKTLKNDVGVALANRSGNVRLEVVRRTDTSRKPFAFYFRIERPF